LLTNHQFEYFARKIIQSYFNKQSVSILARLVQSVVALSEEVLPDVFSPDPFKIECLNVGCMMPDTFSLNQLMAAGKLNKANNELAKLIFQL